MKRILTLLLVMCISFSLCACGEKDNGPEKPAIQEEELSLGTLNSIPEHADFTLFKVTTTEKVTASMDDAIYYENPNDGEVYVDIIFDLLNTGTESVRCDEFLTVVASNADGIEYGEVLYAVETDGATCMSQYENIQPLSEARLHCAVSVPETETGLSIKVQAQDRVYTFDYILGNTIRNTITLTEGQTIEAEDFAVMKFQGIEYTDKVIPSDVSGIHTYYQIDDTNNTYLVIKFDVTNYQNTAKACDTFFAINALYMDKYEYTGFIAVEDADGAGFSSYDDIEPLDERSVYCIIEVPKRIIENEVELTISFDGKEYVYTGK